MSNREATNARKSNAGRKPKDFRRVQLKLSEHRIEIIRRVGDGEITRGVEILADQAEKTILRKAKK